MSFSASECKVVERPTWQQAVRIWLSRRRIAISLLFFTCLVGVNILVVQQVPFNPLFIRNPWVLLADSAILVGLFIRSWSAGTLNKSREVTTHGPYAMVRNPLYLGSFLLMLGFCLLTKDLLMALLVVGPMSYLYWNQVRHEERRLADMFPSQWESYVQTVPRFVPKRFGLHMFRDWKWKMWWLNREYQALATSLVGLVGIYLWYQAAQG